MFRDRLVTVAIAGAVLMACGRASPAVRLADHVTVIDDNAAKQIAVANGALVFPASGNGWLLKAPKGTVLISGYQQGFLRKLVSATQQGQQITVTTTNAQLTDAIVEGKLHTTVDLAQALSQQTGQTGAPNTTHQPLSIDLGTNFGGLELSTGKGLSVAVKSGGAHLSPTLTIDFDISGGKVRNADVVIDGTLDLSMLVDATASQMTTQSGDVKVWESPPIQLVQFIGPVPVVEFVTLSLNVGFNAGIGAALTLESGFSGQMAMTVGARARDGGWMAVGEQSNTFGPIGPTVTTSADAFVDPYARVQLNIRFYDVAGPYIGVQPYFDASYSLAASCDTLRAGAEGDLGLAMDIFNVDFNASLFDVNRLLAQVCPSQPGGQDGGSGDSGGGGAGSDGGIRLPACGCYSGNGGYCGSVAQSWAQRHGCSIPSSVTGEGLYNCQNGTWTFSQQCAQGCVYDPSSADYCATSVCGCYAGNGLYCGMEAQSWSTNHGCGIPIPLSDSTLYDCQNGTWTEQQVCRAQCVYNPSGGDYCW